LKGKRGRRAAAAAVILAGIGLMPSSAVEAQESRALELLEQAGARYRGIATFCASFHQTLEVPLLGETHESRGRLCQAQPDLFSMRWSEPEGDVVVADGAHFWVYYPSADPGQVLQFPMEVRPGGVDLQREFLDSPGEKYHLTFEGEESVAGRPAYVIGAEPVEPAAFKGSTLWLDQDRLLIVKIRIAMDNESVRTLTLSNLDLDPPPDPDRFRFTPPSGAQVIRRGG
jgi:outer membrane lipoprotein-sorting protein